MKYIWRGSPPKWNLFIKKMYTYSYMFKLQSPSKYSPFYAIYLWRLFSTAQNSLWTHQFWCLLVLLPFFISPLPHQQNVSLGGLFSSRWIRRVGQGFHAVFGQKLLNTQQGAGRCAGKSPIVKWTNVLTESLKNFTKAECSLSQQYQLVHWPMGS